MLWREYRYVNLDDRALVLSERLNAVWSYIVLNKHALLYIWNPTFRIHGRVVMFMERDASYSSVFFTCSYITGHCKQLKTFPSICQYFKPGCWKRGFRYPEFDLPNDRRQTDRPIRHSLIMFCRRVEHSFLIVHPSASLILL